MVRVGLHHQVKKMACHFTNTVHAIQQTIYSDLPSLTILLFHTDVIAVYYCVTLAVLLRTSREMSVLLKYN
jgi:hypothetical protein